MDFRPYITIHDRDFSSLITKYSPRTGLVVGATNPFIASSTKHWPHRLMLGELNKNESVPFCFTFIMLKLIFSRLIYNKTMKSSSEMVGALGFSSRVHKRYTSKDRPLLHSWEEAIAKGGHHGALLVTAFSRSGC